MIVQKYCCDFVLCDFGRSGVGKYCALMIFIKNKKSPAGSNFQVFEIGY